MRLIVVDEDLGEAVTPDGRAYVRLASTGRWVEMVPGGPGARLALARAADARLIPLSVYRAATGRP